MLFRVLIAALIAVAGACDWMEESARADDVSTADVLSTVESDVLNGTNVHRHGHSLPAADGWIIGLIALYCSLIVAASVAGGWLPSWIQLTHTRMQTIISFVGGLMLGIGVFHLLPHAMHSLPSVDAAAGWMMGGMLTMFLLIRMFHFHHHGPLEISPVDESDVRDPALQVIAVGRKNTCDHDHDHDHEHEHEHEQVAQRVSRRSETDSGAAVPSLGVDVIGQTGPPCGHAHQLSWVGIAIGLSLHTMIDGIALAASVQAESAHPTFLSLFGLGTFLAVMLHKPLDAVSITSLMAVSGWTQRSRNIVNAGFALMCPIGAMIFLLGVSQLQGIQEHIVGAALAFSAGVFICISLSDLLPEMEFHAHNRTRLTAALIAGIFLAWGITFLEPVDLH